MVSNTKYYHLHYLLLETKCQRLVILNFPDSHRGIPFATSLFDTALQLGFVEFNSQFDNHRLLRRRPARFFGDDIDSGTAFAPLLVA
jgi:hypothetical protein